MIIQGRPKVKKRRIIPFSGVTVQTQSGCGKPVSPLGRGLKFLESVRQAFRPRILANAARQTINRPCPIMALTTDIVSGRELISTRFTRVATASPAATTASNSCSTEKNLFIRVL